MLAMGCLMNHLGKKWLRHAKLIQVKENGTMQSSKQGKEVTRPSKYKLSRNGNLCSCLKSAD